MFSMGDEFYATYRHDYHWFVDVWKVDDKYCVWMKDKKGSQEPLGYYDHMPTWEETKWFYDHLDG